jgi:hypothetical protein
MNGAGATPCSTEQFSRQRARARGSFYQVNAMPRFTCGPLRLTPTSTGP